MAQARLALSRPQQPLQRPSQAVLERLRLVQLASMQQAPLLSQAYLQPRPLDQSQRMLQRMYLLQDWLEHLRSELFHYLVTTISALQVSPALQKLDLSPRLQRLTLLLQVCLPRACVAARWCGEKLFRAKTQIGLLLTTVKHQAGLLLMTVKHQIGKRLHNGS
jgi:hypothetical protein